MCKSKPWLQVAANSGPSSIAVKVTRITLNVKGPGFSPPPAQMEMDSCKTLLAGLPAPRIVPFNPVLPLRPEGYSLKNYIIIII